MLTGCQHITEAHKGVRAVVVVIDHIDVASKNARRARGTITVDLPAASLGRAIHSRVVVVCKQHAAGRRLFCELELAS